MTDLSNSPIGQSLRRRVDERFLTGRGQYTDDVVLPGQTYGYFLRSPHAHARIASIDTTAARGMPGAVAIFTGRDVAESKIGGLPCGWLIHSRDGSPMNEPPHPIIAADKVLHVGDQVALVVAETALQAKDADVVFEDGEFKVAGTDRKVPFAQVALTAYVPHNYPLDKLEPGLNENAFYDPTNFTYPAGSYVCEVEVDPDTGVVTIEKFTAVDDFGNIVNPMIVEGQVHGGLAQGIGQALLEQAVYDPESGQLLTGTYMDYAMPRATDLPMFTVDTCATPCTHNPLGVKGCGEAGAIGSPPALINAITDAIGVRDLAMPATPERVWRALRSRA